MEAQHVIQAANGSLIPIYDPATTAQNPAGAWSRDPFPGTIVPKSRFDPVAKTILDRYVPLPVWEPRTWLLSVAWRKHGLIGRTEVPGPRWKLPRPRA